MQNTPFEVLLYICQNRYFRPLSTGYVIQTFFSYTDIGSYVFVSVQAEPFYRFMYRVNACKTATQPCIINLPTNYYFIYGKF